MRTNNVLIASSIAAVIIAAFFAFDSNLSELAPVFLLLGFVGFGCLIYRKTWSPRPAPVPQAQTPRLAKLSGILGMAGVLCMGASGLSLLDPALQEMAFAGLLGAVLLILALFARIISGMVAKRVDLITGSFSIAAISLLLFALGVAILVFYIGYLLISLFIGN